MSLFGSPKPAPQPEAPSETVRETPALPERGNTVIAKDIVLTGKLGGEGVVQIEGTIEGGIDLKGHVTVSSTGKVKGPVEADVIRIAGLVEGNITCHDHLQLERGGSIEGDVTTGTLTVESGGRLNGRTTMTGEKKTEQPAPSGFAEDLQFGRNYKAPPEESEDEE